MVLLFLLVPCPVFQTSAITQEKSSLSSTTLKSLSVVLTFVHYLMFCSHEICCLPASSLPSTWPWIVSCKGLYFLSRNIYVADKLFYETRYCLFLISFDTSSTVNRSLQDVLSFPPCSYISKNTSPFVMDALKSSSLH